MINYLSANSIPTLISNNSQVNLFEHRDKIALETGCFR